MHHWNIQTVAALLVGTTFALPSSRPIDGPVKHQHRIGYTHLDDNAFPAESALFPFLPLHRSKREELEAPKLKFTPKCHHGYRKPKDSFEIVFPRSGKTIVDLRSAEDFEPEVSGQESIYIKFSGNPQTQLRLSVYMKAVGVTVLHIASPDGQRNCDIWPKVIETRRDRICTVKKEDICLDAIILCARPS